MNRDTFRPLLLALAMAMAPHGSAEARQVVLTSGDLPYSASDNDTITFATDTIISSANGILLSNTDNVFINGQGKTLRFGDNGGRYAYGISLSGTGTYDCRIANLRIIREEGPDDNYGSGNTCIKLSACHDITFDTVDLIIDGHNAQCVVQTGECYNTLFNYGTWTSNSTSFTSRHTYDGTVALFGVGGDGNGNYAFKLNKITIADGPAQGIRFKGKAIVDSCDFTLDHQNTYQGGQNANQYAIIFRQMTAGSVIRNTTITSGSSHGGCRGIILDNAVGASDDYVLVHDNILDLHSGPDAENPTGIMRGIRLRSGGQNLSYVKVYDNTVITTADNNASTNHIGRYTTGIQINSYEGESSAGHIYIYGNTVYARALSADADARAVELMNDISGGNHVELYDNEFYSCNYIMNLQDEFNADGCLDGLFYDNIYGFMDTTTATGNDSLVITDADKRTWYVGNSGDLSTGNVNIDGTYINGASETDVAFAANQNGDITMKRTLRVYVRGQNLLPVHGASVTVTNGNGVTVLSETTTNGGLAKSVVSYLQAASSQGEPTDFGPFDITASLSGDNVQHDSFVVSSLPAGGTDTLTLSQTVGDGTWDDPEQPEDQDTIPPEAPFLELEP